MTTTISSIKTDLFKEDKHYYSAKLKPELLDYDSYYYLNIEGKGAPYSDLFNASIKSIYSTAYTIKNICKWEGCDFVVPKMECYWYIAGGVEEQHKFMQTPQDEWLWKIMIRMPDQVEGHHYFHAQEQIRVKQKCSAEMLEKTKLTLINEGKCAQILHIGSYDEEAESIRKLHGFIDSEQLQITGHHKEIYLNDPRKTAPEKLRTILRYQVK